MQRDSFAPERILGRYALYGEIASGGMATVHLGRLLGQVGFARTVAVKRLHAHLAKDAEFRAMFLDEARLAGRIQHPNVVSTLDVVAIEGELFLVMEYVHGESLARLLTRQSKSAGGIDATVASSIVCGALHGLHSAHEARSEHGEPLALVHRDVSPHNIMVGLDGLARVLDFGVAKAIGRLQTTRDGSMKGKLPYMAAEQIQGRPLDRRVDVYAASVVLWEVLTGRPLFRGDNDAVIFGKVLRGATKPPSRYRPDLPPAVDAIVMRGLSIDPDARWATARELAVTLEETLGVASQRQVGEWVEHLAGDSLMQRARLVEELESVSSALTVAASEHSAPKASVALAVVPGEPAGARPAEPPWSSVPESHVSSLAVSKPGPAGSLARPRSKHLALLAGLLLAAVLAIVVWLLLPTGRSGNVANAAPSDAPDGTTGPATTDIDTSAADERTGDAGGAHDAAGPERTQSEPETTTPKPTATTNAPPRGRRSPTPPATPSSPVRFNRPD